MRTWRWLSLIGLMAWLLGVSLAQTPTLILRNGDANGDNVVDDADLLTVLAGFGTPAADLNGDNITDDAELLVVMSNFGVAGAPAFAGSVSTPSGAFSATLAVSLDSWGGSAQQVKIQLKPAGSEADPNVPIFEFTASVGGAPQNVSLNNLPAGVYTVRAFPATSGRWLRTELSEPLVVGGSAGTPALHVPAPAWAEEVVPTDAVPAVGLGGGPSRAHQVNLASGVYEHAPEPDLVASNPAGSAAVFARIYSVHLARLGRSASGLPQGWTHNYDVRVEPTANGVKVIYPNGATELLTAQQQGAVWVLSAPTGAPYRGVGIRNTQGQWTRVRLHFQDGSAWEFRSEVGLRLFRVYGRAGAYHDISNDNPPIRLFLQLEYDTQGRLSRVLSATGATLLSFAYQGNFLRTATAHRHDGTGYATITYTVQSVAGIPCLTQVSQVNAPNANRWQYGYQARSGAPYLSLVAVPHPNGSGVALSRIGYATNGAVQLLVDGNGHARVYQYQGSSTKVEVYHLGQRKDFEFTQLVNASNNTSAGVRDAANHASSLGYGDPYRPVQYTNRNGQTFSMARDSFGMPTLITTPRGIQWEFTYNRGQNPLIAPPASVSVVQRGYDGTVRTPTEYRFYQATDLAQGSVAGLLSEVRSPRPGTVGTGEQVSTRFYYVVNGGVANLAMVVAPGANNDGRALTTVFFYAVDPWTGESFPARQNLPVAVAVYDKTLAFSDYPSLQTPPLRDDRLIYFERYRYDAQGRLIAVIDAEGNTTALAYNAANQLIEVNYPPDTPNQAPARDVLVYRYLGGPVQQLEVYSGATRFRVYALGSGSEGEARALAVANTRKADLVYDAQYRLDALTGGANQSTGQRHTTDFTYTTQGFAQSTVYPNNDTYTISEHDREGNPVRLLDAQGLLTVLVRSIVDSRVEQVQYPDATGNLAIEYDGFNRVRRLTRGGATPITVEYAYDDNDLVRRVRTTYPGLPPRDVEYEYYPDGSRAVMHVAGTAFTYEYAYHTVPTLPISGRPFAGLRVRVNLPVPTGLRLDTLYDRRGLPVVEQTTNGVYREMLYNGRGLLQALYNRQQGPLNLPYVDFSNLLYDAAGNLVQMDVAASAFGGVPALLGTVYYAYDDNDRQIGERFATSAGDLYCWQAIYDAQDNLYLWRTCDNAVVRSFASNAADQIANSGWGYLNGDLVQMVRFGEGVSLAYNREHQPVRYYNAAAAPPIEVRYFYRPDGLLGGRQAPNYFRWYLYDGAVPVAELNAQSGSVELLYVYGPEGLTQRFAPGGGNRRLYTFDPFGNVVHRVQFGQAYPNVLSGAWHDRQGATYLDRSSTGVDPFPTPDVLDGYLGRYGLFRDPATRPWGMANLTGLITTAYGTAYDPATGRYTSRTGGSQNPYARSFRPEKNFADANWNLVVAFAHAGYTSADPNASEAERFAAGVDAFVRLLAVGGEWASYASLIPGRGGARAAASEASEQLAKRAARELPPVVIGENMERVTAYARRIGAETIDDWLGGRPWSEELNKEWILQMMREGRRVIDIGPDFPRRLKRHLARLRGENAPHPVSSPYSLERCLLKQYQYLHYEKRFTREGKWWGKEY